MKLKFITLALIAFALFSAISVHAQLSDRVNSPTTFKTGTRPVTGNLGITIGTSYNDIQNILDPDRDWEILPVMSFKYYNSNDLVFTIGLKSSKDKIKVKGDVDPAVNGGTLTSFEYRENNSDVMLVPGVEKHFTHSNILDVYVAGRVPLGLRREIFALNQDFEGGNYNYLQQKRNRFFFGADIGIGVQAFIADLPLAIGMEVELSGFGYKGDKTHVIDEDQNSTQEYYTTTIANDFDPAIGSIAFSKLRASTFDVETDLRVTLSYFFRQ